LTEIFEVNRSPAQRYIRRIYYGNLPDPLTDAGQAITYPDGAAVGHLRDGRRYAFEVVFDYGDSDVPTIEPHPEPPPAQTDVFTRDPVRDDRFSSFRAGFEVRTLRRCRRVLMFHHFAELQRPMLVRSTDFGYCTDPDTQLSLLVSATLTSY